MGARRKTKQKPAMVEPVEIPDAEHELVIERAAAIDVAKAAGKVCVRLPGKSGRRFSRVWDVPARSGAITELAEHLVELGIEKVTVESTSDYWRIWYYLLEDGRAWMCSWSTPAMSRTCPAGPKPTNSTQFGWPS